MGKIPHLTSIEVDGWEIDDGEIAHAESPESFFIPDLAERQSLRAGDLAKILFYIRTESDAGEIVDNGERMWVIVSSALGNWYEGTLDNDPYCTKEIAAGMPVWFEARHVIAIKLRQP